MDITEVSQVFTEDMARKYGISLEELGGLKAGTAPLSGVLVEKVLRCMVDNVAVFPEDAQRTINGQLAPAMAQIQGLPAEMREVVLSACAGIFTQSSREAGQAVWRLRGTNRALGKLEQEVRGGTITAQDAVERARGRGGELVRQILEQGPRDPMQPDGSGPGRAG